MIEWLTMMAMISVASWMVFVIAGEKHKSKAFVISFAMLLLGLGYMIFPVMAVPLVGNLIIQVHLDARRGKCRSGNITLSFYSALRVVLR